MSTLANLMPTAELQARDAAHHIHPFTANNALAQKGARVITNAEGVFLTDSDGERILDAMAGLWCVNIGYGRKELADVAARQMNELPYYNTFFQTTHIPAIDLAERLARLAPGNLNHVMFASGGSEANDTNMRLVRTYWKFLGKPSKQIVISRWNAYHGSTVAASALGGMAGMHAQGVPSLAGIHHIGQPNWWAEGGDMSPEDFGLMRARELETAIKELGAENVAAFIAEPVQGAGGVIVPPSTYWPEIQRICDENEILLIADEVICGFGRTGNWFGTNTYDIRPDVMTVAKGLSSGYQPIGASIVSDEVAEVIGRDEFNHGYTYAGHPVAAAVANENLRIMEDEDVVGHVQRVAAPHLAKRWAELGDHPMVGEVKLVGMMGSIALTPQKETRAKFASDVGTIGFMCRERCFANNLIMRHVGDRMIISPPLVIQPLEIDLLIARAKTALDETYEAATKQGLMVPAA
ncbi:aspartate aminotransferase family protein [Chachezhania sediminis]|uniref:aspartate aminotransferase family protein n=1 Tax=Chachezhania sediminis TaxID=2599291 RepID=UPI00131BE43B|nr:aspartate aminotransferase family protein [Chachezhania sediminis]